MNAYRLLGEGKSFYHVISRVVDRQFVFDDEAKEVTRKILRRLESFLGVRVVTYCLMSNHFHLLLEVPDKEMMAPLSEDQLLELLPTLYDGIYVESVRQDLERARDAEFFSTPDLQNARVDQILGRFEKRRGDLSTFVKEFKHRVTRYINKKENRRGTLWESRFKSVLVEGNEGALLTIAAYIDLNPVRAGIVECPEDYRWCGYAEAVAGNRKARAGLGTILSEALIDTNYRADWRRTHNRYRLFVYSEGREVTADPEMGIAGRKGFCDEEIEAVEKAQGALPVAAIVRHRVRYFCDGAVLGTAAFVNEVFARERARFGPKRKTGARKMKGAGWGDLRVLRDLRLDV